jgi:hypothetical protein
MAGLVPATQEHQRAMARLRRATLDLAPAITTLWCFMRVARHRRATDSRVCLGGRDKPGHDELFIFDWGFAQT